MKNKNKTKDVYPKAKGFGDIVTLNEDTVAVACVVAMSEGLTKAQAIGSVLNGSDDVATFNKIWELVANEGKSFRKVNPAEYANISAYKYELTSLRKYLDVNTWVAGILDEKGVSTFTALKALYNTEA